MRRPAENWNVFSSTNVARPYARRVRVLRLETVDALVAFDLPDAPRSAGGTRLAPDVTGREGRLLARAMTYKYAALGIRVGGAKGLVRARPEHAPPRWPATAPRSGR